MEPTPTRSRYASVRSGGILLDGERDPRPSVVAVIHRLAHARTNYARGKPVCRSLDGVRSLRSHGDRECRRCPEQVACTSQLVVELGVDGVATWARLVLSWGNRDNLATFVHDLRAAGIDPVGSWVRASVRPKAARNGRHYGVVTWSRVAR